MERIDPSKAAAIKVVKALQANGYTALFAGGCVRDEHMGRIPNDYDIATDAFPEDVEALFPKTIPIGKAFGVIAVIDNKETIEVATFREEFGTLDGRHPESIQFSAAKEDALRRDFTINGMFYDPIEKQLHDYVGGLQDLEKRTITAIGNPSERFNEDHLRMLRAIRFTHNLGFSLDPATEKAIKESAHLIKKISYERIETELTKILIDSPMPGEALKHLHQVGLLAHILPELLPMIGQKQPPQFHPEGDVFEHTALMLNLMKQTRTPTPLAGQTYTARELAYTLLLHDVGKPSTATMGMGTDGEPRIRFDGHAQVSADMATEILTRLKFPNKEKKHSVEAIRGHMRFIDVQKMRTSKLRKLIGAETFDLEMELHRLDCLGSHALLDQYDFVCGYIKEMKNEPILPQPWICGNDLIERGIKEGQPLGIMLKKAYEAQIEERFADRETLLEWILENK